MDLVAQITDILSQDLPTSPDDTKRALNDCMKLTAPLLQARCAAQAKWYTERDRLRHPKDLKQFTDLDRTIMLDSAVAEYQRTYNELKGLEELLNQRITVLTAFL